jgi:hypothetical protein
VCAGINLLPIFLKRNLRLGGRERGSHRQTEAKQAGLAIRNLQVVGPLQSLQRAAQRSLWKGCVPGTSLPHH